MLAEYRRYIATTIAALLVLATGFAGAVHAEDARPAGDYVPTVLVTGSNRGIGFELVHQYAERGWNVYSTARDPGKAEELQALAKANPKVHVETLDVSDLASVDALAARLKGQPVDVLINNAGITGGMMNQVPGKKMDWDEFDRVLKTNVVGPMKMVDAFLPNLEAGQKKLIINISSSEGSIGSVDSGRIPFYRASKAALNMEMRNLAFMLQGKGIAVAMINPGPVDTDMMKGLPKSMLHAKDTSVRDVIKVIDHISMKNTGLFWNYSGEFLPW